jgi:ribosomal protein L16/L10AE
MKYSKNTAQFKSFKKRYLTGYTYKSLKYGNLGIYFNQSYRVENMHLFDLKRKFKFFLTKSKKGLNNQLWIFITRNYPISKKPKNSRMGKGKGKFVRLCTRVPKNFVFLEFLNINIILLKKIVHYFSLKNNFKISYLQKNTKSLFFKSKNITFYNKYKRL